MKKLMASSEAQLRQDLFVLATLKFRKRGFFVEFGATNGRSLSNTFLLEKKFGWQGILAEPARFWHDNLLANRTCSIDKRCVWTSTGDEIRFRETEVQHLSTILDYVGSDKHTARRQTGIDYLVETVTLEDLLRTHRAPKHIDYLSIDTEGTELSILESFDFSKRSFDVITVEHNNTEQRNGIKQVLEGNGYRRVFEDITLWDDWYLSQDLERA